MKKTLFVLTIPLFLLASRIDTANELWKNKEYKEAYKIYKDEAKTNNPEALYQLGRAYYSGVFVKRDYDIAYKYLSSSSELGYDKAKYNLGVFYSNKKTPYHSYKKAYEIFYEMAKNGDDGAQNRIGMFLQYGIYVKKDYKEAVNWYEKAAKQRNLDAECNLASMYAGGMGVFPNFGRANIFAQRGYKAKHPVCTEVWDRYKLYQYPEDKGFKFKFFTQPVK